MKSVYHAGELAVQRQAGVMNMAARVGNGIHAFIPEGAVAFLQEQPFAVMGGMNAEGQVWASLLVGEPGFMRVVDENTLHIAALPPSGDPLAQILHSARGGPSSQEPGREIGLLIIEPATRRRMRLNGRAEIVVEGGLRVHAREVYANCPKYIQERVLVADTGAAPVSTPSPRVDIAARLSLAWQEWIAHADTFFIASAAPEGGADASHRGGSPGFARVVDANTLLFPDYCGNTMFNTLGNIAANPNAGLLFVDWQNGDTLQLTGKARILWEPEHALEFAGAERVVEFHVEQAVHSAGANPLRFAFVRASRFNPAPNR